MGAPFTLPEEATIADVRRELLALIRDSDERADERHRAEALARYMRRQLEAAAEIGFAMLDALDRPRLVGPDFAPIDRAALSDALDVTIATLDALEGDADAEPYLAGYYNGAADPTGEGEPDSDDELSLGWRERVGQLDLGIGQDDGEPTLGAPERHPYFACIGTPYYEPANGSFRRFPNWYSQASWAQGERRDGEGEAEAGYDLPESDGTKLVESDDDGLSSGEKDESETEPELGSAIGDGNQEHWAQGFDHEAVNEDGGDEDREPAARPISPRRPDPMGFRLAEERRAISRRARDMKAKLHPSAPRDPDTVTIFRKGQAYWSGPYVTRDGVPVLGWAT